MNFLRIQKNTGLISGGTNVFSFEYFEVANDYLSSKILLLIPRAPIFTFLTEEAEA